MKSACPESEKRNLVLRPWNPLFLVCLFTPSAEAPQGMSETLGFSVKDLPVWDQNTQSPALMLGLVDDMGPPRFGFAGAFRNRHIFNILSPCVSSHVAVISTGISLCSYL